MMESKKLIRSSNILSTQTIENVKNTSRKIAIASLTNKTFQVIAKKKEKRINTMERLKNALNNFVID